MGDWILHFFVALIRSGSKDAYSLLPGFDVPMKFVAPRGISGNKTCIGTLQMNQKFVVHGVGMELRHSAQKIQVVVTMKDIFNALLKLSGQGFDLFRTCAHEASFSQKCQSNGRSSHGSEMSAGASEPSGTSATTVLLAIRSDKPIAFLKLSVVTFIPIFSLSF